MEQADGPGGGGDGWGGQGGEAAGHLGGGRLLFTFLEPGGTFFKIESCEENEAVT